MREDRTVSALPESVEQRLASLPTEYAASARRLLPRRDELPLSPPYERVLHAVLDLADGDWQQLRHHAESAKRDWRDVLWWAEERGSSGLGPD